MGRYTSVQAVVEGYPFEYRNERQLAVMDAFSSSFLICWKGVSGLSVWTGAGVKHAGTNELDLMYDTLGLCG